MPPTEKDLMKIIEDEHALTNKCVGFNQMITERQANMINDLLKIRQRIAALEVGLFLVAALVVVAMVVHGPIG